ncbi:hypothetical protein, partial [Streptomyces sp. NPDC059656]|uniref:hypothetical protein n=1 Tax=Streptomyces sp. NPDC059656 TaxID=3346898 RepID=UPI0036BFB691
MVSVGDRLSRARVRAFVGREEQLGYFESALAGDPQAPFAFYAYGPGGIGKSTLLRRMVDHARVARPGGGGKERPGGSRGPARR